MKLKELHALMQDMQPFENPKVELEQYPTGPHIASRMLYTVGVGAGNGPRAQTPHARRDMGDRGDFCMGIDLICTTSRCPAAD